MLALLLHDSADVEVPQFGRATANVFENIHYSVCLFPVVHFPAPSAYDWYKTRDPLSSWWTSSNSVSGSDTRRPYNIWL